MNQIKSILTVGFIMALCSISGVYSSQNLTDMQILAKDSPEDLQQNFPTYLSGYTEDGVSIWVVETGKWDFRKYVAESANSREALGHHIKKIVLMWRDSAKISSTQEAIIVGDMDGFDIRQAGHLPTIKFLLSIVGYAGRVFKGVKIHMHIVNANYLFQRFWELASPLFGDLAKYVELYGTNERLWKPKLLKVLPRDQLPEWLGGTKDHRPLLVYGR